jgi:hypothetical protein
VPEASGVGPRLTGSEIAAILYDPAASFALKDVLRDWLQRDPADAARDAETLAVALASWADIRMGEAS